MIAALHDFVGVLESGKIQEVDYVAIDISPDPDKSPWPQSLKTTVWCPPSVNLNFSLNGRQIQLNVQHNEQLQLDSIPVMVGDGRTSELWSDNDRVRKTIKGGKLLVMVQTQAVP